MYDDTDLRAAYDAGALDEPNYRNLMAFLAERLAARPRSATIPAVNGRPRFDLTHLLWYAGALIVMTAMGLFTNAAFNALGGFALAAIGTGYAVGFLILGNWLWTSKDLRTPGGLAVAVAVAMVPMIVYGVQDGFDLWRFAQGDPGQYRGFFPKIHGSWIYMEVATILAATLAMRIWPYPFVLLPAAVAAWFLSMDVVVWLAGSEDYGIRANVSVVFGLVLMAIGWVVDLRHRPKGDYAFWLHVFGAMTFWGGLVSQGRGDPLGGLIFCVICVGLLLLAVYLDRRVYAVFGTIGVAMYLGDLASKVFRDVLSFSFALSALGLAIIGLGIWYHRRRDRFALWLDANLPAGLKALRPVAG